MKRKLLLILLLFVSTLKTVAQGEKPTFLIGISTGFGSEFNNSDYTFSNQFYKLQLYYVIKETNHFQYEILIQPEINFAKHQLLNFYFVKPETPDFEQKREEYTKLKNVREYALNLGFLIRKPIHKSCSFYILGSVGPLVTDTETERMSKGFAFADALAVGFTLKVQKVQFDIRPEVRHVSNAGLSVKNAGYNTKNIEFGISFPL